MNTTTDTARSILSMAPAQGAYALALAAFEAAKLTAEALKVERGVDYTAADTDAAIDAMAEVEGECDRVAGVLAAERALRVAEQGMIAWGIGRACEMSPSNATTLRDLQSHAERDVVARAKVVDLCFRLAA